MFNPQVEWAHMPLFPRCRASPHHSFSIPLRIEGWVGQVVVVVVIVVIVVAIGLLCGSGTSSILWFLCYWVAVQRWLMLTLVQVARLYTTSSSTQVWHLALLSFSPFTFSVSPLLWFLCHSFVHMFYWLCSKGKRVRSQATGINSEALK